jgi:hypothetical protein
MSAIKELSLLVNALDKFARMPIGEIRENKEMMDQIREVFNAHGVNQILNSIKQEMVAEKNERFDQQIEMSEQKGFLYSYSRFKAEQMRIESAGRNIYATGPLSADLVTARNAKPRAADKKALKESKVAGEWQEIFNSVYANDAIKINVPGDPTQLMSFIDYSPYIFNYAKYLSVPTLSEFIDRPIDLAMKKLPEFEIKKVEAVEEFKKIIQAEKLEHILRDYLLYASLSPRGSLLVPIKQKNRIRWQVFNDSSFSYGLAKKTNSIISRYSISKVGDIFCLGVRLVDGISCLFNCPGFEPLYAIGKNKMSQIIEASNAWNLYVAALKIMLVRAQVIIQKWDGGGMTDTAYERLKAQLERLSQTMGLSTPIEQPEGAQLDIMNNNIGPGTADIATVFQQLAGILTGMAPEYFFGGNTTTYSASSFNIATTNENIHAKIQRPQLEPAWRFILNTHLMHDERMAPFKIAEDDFTIKSPSIYEETEGERVDIDGKKIDNLTKMRDYRELEDAFHALKVLPKNITFKRLPPDKDQDGNTDGAGDLDENGKPKQPIKPPETPLPDTDSADGMRPRKVET